MCAQTGIAFRSSVRLVVLVALIAPKQGFGYIRRLLKLVIGQCAAATFADYRRNFVMPAPHMHQRPILIRFRAFARVNGLVTNATDGHHHFAYLS